MFQVFLCSHSLDFSNYNCNQGLFLAAPNQAIFRFDFDVTRYTYQNIPILFLNSLGILYLLK